MIKPEPNSILIMLNRFYNDYLYFVIDFDFDYIREKLAQGTHLAREFRNRFRFAWWQLAS